MVGANNSSNSNRLREIGVEEGLPSYLIADASDLDPTWIEGVKAIGLTAGASAPEDLVLERDRGPAQARPTVEVRADGRRRGEYRIPPAAPSSASRGHRTRHADREDYRRGSAVTRKPPASGPTSSSSTSAARKRYPLVLMLEPLFRCNLACAGCGKIDYPDEILNQRLQLRRSAWRRSTSAARRWSRSPAASRCCTATCREIVEGFIAKKKFVILCTNALLLTKKIDQYKPSPFFTWSIHLDGDQVMHDKSVCQDGVYDKAVEAIKLAKSKGFRVQINCTLFDGADPERVAAFFDEMKAHGHRRHHRLARLCL